MSEGSASGVSFSSAFSLSSRLFGMFSTVNVWLGYFVWVLSMDSSVSREDEDVSSDLFKPFLLAKPCAQ